MPGKIYILGAGASRDDTKNQEISMPLATDFFNPRYINNYWPNIALKKKAFIKSDLAKILKNYFSFKVDSSKKFNLPKKINVEVVFSFLENFETIYISNTYEKDIIKNAKQELLEYIKDLILECPATVSPEFMRTLEKEDSKEFNKLLNRERNSFRKTYKLHNSIAKSLEKQDSVISFNWDLIMDMALWVNNKKHYFKTRDKILNPNLQEIYSKKNCGYFSYNDTHRGYYLKMHGSANYAICSDVHCVRSEHPIAIDEWDANNYQFLQCSYCFAPLKIFILPPHVNKTYKNNRFFKLQAGIAAKKLNIASEIIIVGYSLPEFDFEANTILRLSRLFPNEIEQESCNFLEKVTIVNPEVVNKAFIAKIKETLGLENSSSNHGRQVNLETFESVDDYLRNN